MVEHEGGTLRGVAWSEVFPWLRIFRCFRIAVMFRLLLLAALGIFLTTTGWDVIGRLFFSGNEEIAQRIERHDGRPWRGITYLIPEVNAKAGLESVRPPSQIEPMLTRGPMHRAWAELTGPLVNVFRLGLTATEVSYQLLCGLWALAVWGLLAGAITRFAAVRLAAEERVGFAAMMQYASGKWRSYFAAPLIPLVGVAIIVLFLAAAGAIARMPLGAVLIGITWPLALLGALVMAILLLGLLFGWPLMWPTISAEGRDSFDALGRCYTYVFQRPLHYLFYVVVAAAFGGLGWYFVSHFAAAVIYLTHWGLSWGAGNDLAYELVYTPMSDVAEALKPAAYLVRLWDELVKLLAAGFLFSYFWTAMTAIYFLLRRDADATEMDEVFLGDERLAEGLPPVTSDAAGAPVLESREPANEAE
jgi:hypothetical protein